MRKICIISLGYSVFGSLELYCVLNYLSIVGFGQKKLYPFLYPFTIVGGILGFFSIIGLFLYNVKVINKDEKYLFRKMMVSAAVVAISFMPALTCWNYILQKLEEIL